MSFAFIKELQEAAITFLGTVPASSISTNNTMSDELTFGDRPEGSPDDQMDQNPDQTDPQGDPELNSEEGQDPDKMGDIRVVKGAHLVFKRQESDGTFTELWIYNIGEHVNDAIETKKAILAGTDIPDGKMRSEDGKQMYQLSTLGNAQMLSIEGLAN